MGCECKYPTLRNYLSIIFLFVASINSITLLAQEAIRIEFHNTDDSIVFKTFQKKPVITESSIIQCIKNLRNQGYLLASIDSSVETSSENVFYVNVGKKYDLNRVKRGNVPLEILSNGQFKRVQKRKRVEKWGFLLDVIIENAENRGYPFASVSYTNINLKGTGLAAEIDYQPGPYITYDTLQLNGNANIKASYLSKYLNVETGEPYSEKSFQNVEEQLEQLDYIVLNSGPRVEFFRERAQVTLDVDKRKVNQFDFALGFFPNQSANENLLITGLLDLSLKNLFGRGIRADLNWERFKQESQSLDIYYAHPYIFKIPFEIDFRFSLLREDSTFSNTKLALGLNKPIRNHHTYGIEFNRNSTRTQSGISDELIAEGNFNSSDLNLFGGRYAWRKVKSREVQDFLTKISFQVSAGRKSLVNTMATDSTDSLDSNSFIAIQSFQLNTLFRLSRNFYLYTALNQGHIQNDNVLVNESFRLGGLRSLRGFNENTFFAKTYLVNQSELRVHYAYDGYVFLFFDHAFIDSAIPNLATEYVFGTGLGLSLRTRTGNFRFIYAFGKSDQQDFNSRNGKIHFGFQAVF